MSKEAEVLSLEEEYEILYLQKISCAGSDVFPFWNHTGTQTPTVFISLP